MELTKMLATVCLLLHATLLLNYEACVAASQALGNQTSMVAQMQTYHNINSQVPVFLSNNKNISISLTANATSMLAKTLLMPMPTNKSTTATVSATSNPAVQAQKVPSRYNVTASEANVGTGAVVAFSSQQTSPTSIFFSNYNNQQNVMQLVRNVDLRLRNIRNVEMRVATIQEIFDSLHFSTSSFSQSSKNTSDSQQKSSSACLEQDLQIFSKRLSKKLQKAKHIVLELRDFFRYNISKLVWQRRSPSNEYDDEGDDADSDDEFDIEIDDAEAVDEAQSNSQNPRLFLNTYIQPFGSASSASASSMSSSSPATQENYNKQQIQILNYLKTERHSASPTAAASLIVDNFLNEQDVDGQDQSLELNANAYIVEKLQNLKAALIKSDVPELPLTNRQQSNVRSASSVQNAKLKFLGNHFKHIYFLSRSDHASDHSERYYYDLHFRHLYVAAIKYKYVFLLLDVGSAMNAELLELTKSFVNNILQLLSNTDLISIVTIADEAHPMILQDTTSSSSPDDASIPPTGIYYATRQRKEEILNYIHNINVAPRTQTNHTQGFEYAFEILQKLQNGSSITAQNPIEFVYITRGLLTKLSDATQVLRVIANGQRLLQQPIVIHTCAVVLDEKRLMHEKQFLSDISMQNYTKYEIDTRDWSAQNLMGKFFVLTKMHPDTLIRVSTAIFEHSFEERYLSASFEVHPPVVDAWSKDAIVSITHAVAPYGVVGVNLYLADLIEDVVNYRQQTESSNNHDFSYAFLIDRSGLTIAHPAFPRPITQSQTPFPVDIGFLENSTDFAAIRRHMLQEENGNITTSVFLMHNRRMEHMERSYHWQSVLGIYTLCLVSTNKRETFSNATFAQGTNTNDNAIKSSTLHVSTTIPLTLKRFTIKENMPVFHHPSDYDYSPSMDLLYHRLDLMPPAQPKTCRYFRQIATLDAPTLFLSASAFESPFTFIQNNRLSSQQTQMRTVESIMAYIKDSTRLLANPGLRPQIRHEVNALYNAMQHLRKRHQDARGSLKHYIIRRYIATVNGVLQVYPGCLLSDSYDPTRRPWFRKAMQQPGKIISTEPYLDAGGAGYIITIAHTIFEGKANALHSVERDQPVAIVALDLPYAFYYKLILESTPLCQLNNIKCLLFENEGYLIAHPSMLEPSSPLKNQRRPHEHLTHKESYLANDILNHKMLVRKLACANYQNRTLQRYYVFNTSLSDILTNVVHGERTKYAIALVRGSNVFAAVLNSTCDGGAFCPCSTIDRICLNCNRMDQMDCECPCECPMDVEDVYEGESLDVDADEPFSNYTQQYPYCEPPSEHFIALPETGDHELSRACLNINCDVYGTQSECLAVMGCEWCQQDLDGNGFMAGFCVAQASCFNGVLSSLTPYGDLDDVDLISAHGYNPGQKQNSYSAFGPVGGAIVVLGIVIGFAIYCYRHNLDTHAQDQFYIDSMQEENYGLPLSRFNFDDCQAHDEPPGSSGGYDHPAAQRQLIHPADISPYHMSTGSSYRRPPNGESDHGYSTMTPHEDSSDHQCFTLAEPLLLNDKRNSKSDTLSISTSISSPTNRHQTQNHNPYQQTPIPGKEPRYNLTSPKKFHASLTTSPARIYEQTTLPLCADAGDEAAALGAHYTILAPVTVHRHMETSES